MLKKLWQLVNRNKFLVLILLMAATLRFGGVNPGYSQYHPDEPVVYGSAVNLVRKNTLDPGRYDYPAPVIIIQMIFFRLIFIPLAWINYFVTHISQLLDGTIRIQMSAVETKRVFQLYILGVRDINALFWGRYVTALFSLGNVFLVYILGKKLFRKEVGLLAAFFLAFNFKQVINSHISLPDIYNSFFLLLSFLVTLKLWKIPTKKNYLLAGLAAGVSVSTKYQPQALFPLLLVHLFLSIKKGKIDFKKLFSPSAFTVIFIIPLVFLLTNPYVYIHLETAIGWISFDLLKYGLGSNRINLFPLSYIYHIDFGPPLLIASVIGLILTAKHWQKFLILFLPLAYFLYVFTYSTTGGFYIRNIINISPILVIFAGYAIWQVIELLKTKLPIFITAPLVVATLVVMVFVPAKNSIIDSYYYSKQWNYPVMAKWLEKHLPSDAVVAATSFDIPGGPKMTKTEFELDGNFSLAEHKEAGATWALMNLDWASGNFYSWMTDVNFDNLVFWNKPLDMMRNTFHGLAAEELFRYQTFSATKPWQAPGQNLIIAKIPQWPEVEEERIKYFDFNLDFQDWRKISYKDGDALDYKFDVANGFKTKGSLVFLPGPSKSWVTRTTSPLIEIKEGHLYRVSGYLKTEKSLPPRERDGFLRIDFYSEAANPAYGANPDIEKVGMISAVSSRVWGTDNWVKKEVVARAPVGSVYMTIAFQNYNPIGVKTWLDDVEVFESKDVVDDITSHPPYYYRKIDLNNLYPFSHGNL